MIALAYIALFAAPLIAAAWIIAHRGTVRSVAAVYVAGWLALPLLALKVQGLPSYDKALALQIGVLVGLFVARPGALAFRPSWVDLPMLAWCLVPIASSLDNGLGLYDGLSTAFRQAVVWGTPYWLGRGLAKDQEFLPALGVALLLGAVAYAPLCLIESRMAPQLHLWVYGIRGVGGFETADFFGPLRYKASVFLATPLELTPLLGIATLFGFWLWKSGRLQAYAGVPMRYLVPVAGFAALMGKSLGGFGLTITGLGTLLMMQRTKRAVCLVLLTLVVPLYVTTRLTDTWSGQSVVDFIKTYISERRAESFGFRLANEDILVDKAMQRPVFGWGGWGRARVYDDDGKDISVTDGMWVIGLGDNGVVGLAAFYGAMLLPVLILVARRGKALATDGRCAAQAVACVAVTLHAIDCLANAMPNPLYPLMAGAIATAANTLPQALPRKDVPFRRRAKRVSAVVRTPATEPRRFEAGQSTV